MVVILIIGILIAIALPTFLGARTRSQDRAAQTDLRTGLAAALTFWAESGSYLGFDEVVAAVAEPSLGWLASGSVTTPGAIVIQEPDGSVDDGPELLIVTRSPSGTEFCIRQLAAGPAFVRGQGPPGTITVPADCAGGW